MQHETTTAAIAAEARSLARRADAMPLPAQHLSGWSSLCAREYAAGIAHLEALRQELQTTLHSLGRAL